MKSFHIKSLFAAASLAAAGFAHAAPTGYTDYSTSLGGSWSLWDAFPAGPVGPPFNLGAASPFSGRSADTGTSGAVMSASYGTGFPGASGLPDGLGTENSEIYTGGASAAFSISAKTMGTLDTLVLQIKQDAGSGSMLDTSGLESYFVPTLNGIVAINSSFGDPFTDSATSDSMVITTWIWTGLDIDAGQLINLSFDGAAGKHISMDGFRIDADTQLAVPEPSTYALIGLGLGVVLWSVRRRTSARLVS
jgi:PEP-CTERM motif